MVRAGQGSSFLQEHAPLQPGKFVHPLQSNGDIEYSVFQPELTASHKRFGKPRDDGCVFPIQAAVSFLEGLLAQQIGPRSVDAKWDLHQGSDRRPVE